MHPQKLLNILRQRKRIKQLQHTEACDSTLHGRGRRPPKEELLWSICTEDRFAIAGFTAQCYIAIQYRISCPASTQAWMEELQPTEKEIIDRHLNTPNM